MTRMPFGRGRDVELEKAPCSYLYWLRRQPRLGAWLAREIDAVLNDRAAAEEDESFEEWLEKSKQEHAKDERRNRKERGHEDADGPAAGDCCPGAVEP